MSEKLKRHNKRITGLAFLDVLNFLITSLPFSDALNVLVSSAADSQWMGKANKSDTLASFPSNSYSCSRSTQTGISKAVVPARDKRLR
nr:hypothetical protein [Tanacetum cinerariifolium]